MKNILRIGLTGGIGSGKSTACKIFSELGVPVIDADQISHVLVKKGNAAYSLIRNTFGNDIIMDDGEINRSRLRKLVFNDKESRIKLEKILHPMVYSEIEKQVSKLQSPYCVLCIPLLIETNATDRVDRVLVIDISEKKQEERTYSRDGESRETIAKIIQAQVSRRKRLDAADDIINNDGNIEALREKIIVLDNKYKQIMADSSLIHSESNTGQS